MTSVLITIDGVLADTSEDPSFAAAKLVPAGALLYRSLTPVTSVKLISLQPQTEGLKVDYWLRAHNFRDHVELIYDPYPDEMDRGVLEVITRARQRGAVDLVIEADPERAARFVHHGAYVSVIAKPSYTRGEFQPGEKTPSSWESVVAELDKQHEVFSTDERVIRHGETSGTEQ